MTFNKYIEILINGVPHNVYVIVLLTFCIGAVFLLGIYKRGRGWRCCLALLLFEYVFLIYSSTVFFRRALKMRVFDFTPFWSYNHPDLFVENVMNILIFAPIGMLMGMAFRGVTWKKVLVIGMCLSVGIEVMQFVFKKGFSEVDDVIHNTLGCIIGYGIYRLLTKVLLLWQPQNYLRK